MTDYQIQSTTALSVASFRHPVQAAGHSGIRADELCALTVRKGYGCLCPIQRKLSDFHGPRLARKLLVRPARVECDPLRVFSQELIQQPRLEAGSAARPDFQPLTHYKALQFRQEHYPHWFELSILDKRGRLQNGAEQQTAGHLDVGRRHGFFRAVKIDGETTAQDSQFPSSEWNSNRGQKPFGN